MTNDLLNTRNAVALELFEKLFSRPAADADEDAVRAIQVALEKYGVASWLAGDIHGKRTLQEELRELLGVK